MSILAFKDKLVKIFEIIKGHNSKTANESLHNIILFLRVLVRSIVYDHKCFIKQLNLECENEKHLQHFQVIKGHISKMVSDSLRMCVLGLSIVHFFLIKFSQVRVRKRKWDRVRRSQYQFFHILWKTIIKLRVTVRVPTIIAECCWRIVCYFQISDTC